VIFQVAKLQNIQFLKPFKTKSKQFQPKAEIIQGTGTLTWLSAKAGLITCHNNTKMVISFQIKDFCDQVGNMKHI